MTEPERIRRDIEGTQRDLSANVNALTEKVTPSRIVERRVDRVRTAFMGAKDKVMGTATDATSTVGDKVGSTTSAATDPASTWSDRTRSAADDVTDRAQEAKQHVRSDSGH